MSDFTRHALAVAITLVVGSLALAGCTKAPTGTVSGVITEDGRQVVFTDVKALPLLVDDRQIFVDGQPAMDLVFTARAQGGDSNTEQSALDGGYGDAPVVSMPGGANSAFRLEGMDSPTRVDLTAKDFKVASAGAGSNVGQITGEITSGGPIALPGHKLDVDLTFRAKGY